MIVYVNWRPFCYTYIAACRNLKTSYYSSPSSSGESSQRSWGHLEQHFSSSSGKHSFPSANACQYFIAVCPESLGPLISSFVTDRDHHEIVSESLKSERLDTEACAGRKSTWKNVLVREVDADVCSAFLMNRCLAR